MPITFTALSVVHTDGTADGALLLLLDGYGPTITMASGFADGAMVLSGDATAYESDADVEPMLPTEGDGAVYVGMDAVGSMGIWGSSDGSIPMAGEAYATMPGATYTGFVDGGFALAGVGLETAPLDAYGFLVDFTPRSEGFGGLLWDRVVDSLAINGGNDSHVTAVLTSVLRFAGDPGGVLDSASKVESTVSFDEALSVLFMLLVEEGVVFGDAATTDRLAIARAIDRLLVEGHANSLQEATGIATTGLVFGTLSEMLAMQTTTDVVALGQELSGLFTATESLVEAAVFDAQSAPALTGLVLVEDSLSAGAAPASAGEFAALLRESVGFSANLSLDSGEYVAWVMNTESAGLSRYTNYPFNSFMVVGGRHYGVTSAGLHRLDGDTDDGAEIRAKLRMGLSDLGSRVLKGIPEAYIGYSSNGSLLLRTVTVNAVSGEKEAANYRLHPKAAAAIREHRFKMGRGVRSVDWAFELENVDGADFELDSIEFHPIRMDRRTRS